MVYRNFRPGRWRAHVVAGGLATVLLLLGGVAAAQQMAPGQPYPNPGQPSYPPMGQVPYAPPDVSGWDGDKVSAEETNRNPTEPVSTQT